jgi:hypothetical protein
MKVISHLPRAPIGQSNVIPPVSNIISVSQSACESGLSELIEESDRRDE